VNPRRNPRNDSIRAEMARYLSARHLTDDERATYFGLPEGCRIREGAKIIAPELFKCGLHVWIGEGAILDASGGLEVGDHTSIGLNTMVWTHSSHLCNLAMQNQIGSGLIYRRPTRIGSGCSINGPSVVLPGVTIGDRVLLLPMSVVVRDLPPNCVAGGNPARLIEPITDEYLQREMKKLGPNPGPPLPPRI
jgi:acetyltransferase-like isoleucine patch superfamily enzyme